MPLIEHVLLPNNRVRLLHYRHPVLAPDAAGYPTCPQCGGPWGTEDHWAVRWRIAASKQAEANTGFMPFCSEKCAREVYQERGIEVSLVTGEKPENALPPKEARAEFLRKNPT